MPIQRAQEDELQLKSLDFVFWAIGLLGHCVLLTVIWMRHRASRFPVFTTLIAMNIVRTVALFFTHRYGSNDSYFYAYWTFAFVDVLLQLAVVYEMSSCIFRPLGPWAPDVQRSFSVLIGGCLAVAALLTWLATPPIRTVRLAVVTRGDFFSSVLMSELFVVMLALSVTMGFTWRTHVARIAQGFGVYAIFGVLTEGAHTYFGSDKNHNDLYARITYVRMVLYFACLIYWTWSLARNEPEPRKLPEELRLELQALQRRVAAVLQGFRTVRSA